MPDSDPFKILDNKKILNYLYNKTPLGIAIFDTEGNLIQANKNFKDIWNLSSPSETYKLNLFQHIDIPPSELKQLKNKEEINFITGISLREFEKKTNIKINQYAKKFIKFNINPIEITNTHESHYLVYCEDITERILTENRLEENETKFKTIVENSNEGIFIIDDNYRFVYANKKLEEIIGYTIKEIIGQDFRKFLAKDSLDKVVDHYIRRQRGEDLEKMYEFNIKRGDGEVRRVKINSTATGDIYDGIKTIAQIVDITEKKKTERELEESEEKFRILGEQALMSILILQNNEIKYLNKRLGESLGYSKQELKEWTFQDLIKHIHPDDRAFTLKQIQKNETKDNNKIKRYQFRFKTKNGGIRWQEAFSKPVPYNGKPADLISIIDITDRKKSEIKLKESEEQFRTIAEQHFMGIIIIQDFKIKYFNHKFIEFTGYSADEIKNWKEKEFLNIIHPDDQDFITNMIYKKYRGEIKEVKNYEFRIKKKNGDLIWVEIFSKTIPYRGEEADLTSLIDISDRKEAEEKLKESEEKFRGIFQAIPDLFFLVDSNTTVLEYRGQQDKLFLPPEEFLNKKLDEILPNELRKKAIDAILRTIKTKEPQLVEYNLKIDNKMRYFEARLLYYSENKVAIFIREISQRKKAEEMIKEEVRRLKEIDDMRRDLISRVSHELKTPIMAISGATEYLLESYKEEFQKEQIDFLKMIDSNEKRLEKLIENLLDISRINYQKIQLSKQKYNISSLIKSLSNEMRYLFESRKLEFGLNVPEKIELIIDKVRIEQVIMNLISNAIKNTPPGGLIQISAEKTKHYIEISVSDTGVGLTGNEIDKLFTQFGKIERYGKGLEFLDISGSGLGLYISKKIVEMHNGEITVESRGRNKGCTFTIHLPKN
ncbi:MAG: PAS domain-containing sensor histidine kinase [Promethearchaeati archaeon]